MKQIGAFLAVSVVNYAIGLLIAWLRRLVYHPSVPPFFGQVFDVFDPYVTSFILIAILVTINSAFLQRLGMRLGIRKSVVISIHIWGFALAWLANQIGDYQAWFAVQPPTAPSTLKDPWAWWSSTGGKEVVAWYSRRERELITTPLWVTRPLQLVISSAVIGFIIADDD